MNLGLALFTQVAYLRYSACTPPPSCLCRSVSESCPVLTLDHEQHSYLSLRVLTSQLLWRCGCLKGGKGVTVSAQEPKRYFFTMELNKQVKDSHARVPIISCFTSCVLMEWLEYELQHSIFRCTVFTPTFLLPICTLSTQIYLQQIVCVAQSGPDLSSYSKPTTNRSTKGVLPNSFP